MTFRQEDLLATRLADATVATLFLSRNMNERLKPKLQRELAPGARVVSSWHRMPDWTPERTVVVPGRQTYEIYLWRIRSP